MVQYCLVVRTRHMVTIVRALLREARSREPDLPQVRCTFAGTVVFRRISSNEVKPRDLPQQLPPSSAPRPAIGQHLTLDRHMVSLVSQISTNRAQQPPTNADQLAGPADRVGTLHLNLVPWNRARPTAPTRRSFYTLRTSGRHPKLKVRRAQSLTPVRLGPYIRPHLRLLPQACNKSK